VQDTGNAFSWVKRQGLTGCHRDCVMPNAKEHCLRKERAVGELSILSSSNAWSSHTSGTPIPAALSYAMHGGASGTTAPMESVTVRTMAPTA
jgi:hypothetical protein